MHHMSSLSVSVVQKLFLIITTASFYREFLPGADPDHLLAADCPFSQLTGKHVVVIYDASGKGQPNPCASRLTTNVENGLEIEVK